MKIRSLIVEVATKWVGEAQLRRVKVVGDQVAKSLRSITNEATATRVAFAGLADAVVSDAARMAKAVREVGGLRVPRAANDAPRSSGGGGRRGGRDPLDDAIKRANRSEATRAGLAAGATAINDAQKALGSLSTASDKAKARISDLTSQVERNRREMAALKAEAVRTGDADGTLAARMKGLAVATGQASVELSKARGELRRLEGGFVAAFKKATDLQARMTAVGTFLGNAAFAGASRAFRGITDGIVASAKAAIDFESGLADVRKVLPDSTTEADIAKLSAGMKDLGARVGVLPQDVAALTASLAQSGIAGDELLKTAEDAAKLKVAFGVTGEEAGQSIAKLRTGLNLSREEVNSLTGSINELSNNLAATAPQIIDATQRVGSIAKSANVSAESTAALATAMIASGANSEIAATGTKNFIAALGAGSAATRKQREAFSALGLTSEEVARQIVRGGKDAEDAIKLVVGRIGQLGKQSREDVLPVLIEMFGKESIGAIGPLATNIDLLTQAFDIAGNKAKALNSVQTEYEKRSKTTAAASARLKAHIAVLAIELGDALLPHINKVVEFLTSPEGKEWGREAVARATAVITGLASAIETVVSFFVKLNDKIGLTGIAIGGLGMKILALAGPWGVVAAAAVTALAYVKDDIAELSQALVGAVVGVNNLAIAHDALRAKAGMTEKLREEEDKKLPTTAPGEGRTLGYGPAPMAAGPRPDDLPGLASARASISGKVDISGMSEEQKQATFNALVARRKTLKPSEQKLLRALSKDLDKRIPTGGSHFFNDEQRRLMAEYGAANKDLGGVLDASRTGIAQRVLEAGKHAEEAKLNRATQGRGALKSLLEQGRERKKGVLGGAKNELDRAVEAQLLSGPSLGVSGGRSGSSAVAGPAISNTYNVTNNANIQQEIRIEGQGDTTPERIRSAGRAVAGETVVGWQEAAAVFASGST